VWNHIDSRDWLPRQARIACSASAVSGQSTISRRYSVWKTSFIAANSTSSTGRPSTPE